MSKAKEAVELLDSILKEGGGRSLRNMCLSEGRGYSPETAKELVKEALDELRESGAHQA